MTTTTQAANGEVRTAPPRPKRPAAPKIENIPAELRERPQWVVWQYVFDGHRWTKVLYQSKKPDHKASSTRRATWSSFNTAWEAYQRGGSDGIGFVFSADDPYFGVDLDNCLADGKLLDWAQPYVAQLEATYSEVSPSGNGIKFYGRGKLPGKTGGKSLPLGLNETGTIEAYDHARFFAVTGETRDKPDIVELQDVADEVYRVVKERPDRPPAGEDPPRRDDRPPAGDRRSPEYRARAYVFAPGFPDSIAGQDGHGRLYHVACVLVDGFGLSREQAMSIFRDWNAQKATPPESEYQVEHKLDDAIANHPVPSLKLLNADRLGYKRSGSTPSAKGDQAADALPVIEITTKEFEVNDQAIAALSRDPGVYQRNLKLVTVAIDEKQPQAGAIKRAAGTPLIRPIQAAWLREDLTRVARWMKEKTTRDGGGVWIPAHPPDWSVAAIMVREHWPKIRRLVGIIEAPTLRPDGSVIEKPGFDPATGLLYIPSQSFPPVPVLPTQADARKAALTLLDLVSDFPFKDGHDAAWLAALLTAMARLLIDGPVPLFLFEANVSGAGKTLLCDLIAIIVTGRPMTRTGYAHDPVEMGKQISATALAGDQLVLFDNLDNGGLFGNPALDRALTGRTWRDRVLGKLEMTPNLDLIAVFFASGNNTVLCSDVARRIVQNRLESTDEHPEERTGFRIPDLLAHAAENRGDLVVAALTILRAYILAGEPPQKLTPMDFVAWCGLIRNAIFWATGKDPCKDHRDLAASNSGRRQSAALVEAWYEHQAERSAKGFTSAELLRTLGEDKDCVKYLSLRDALAELSSRTKSGELPSSGTIGKRIQAIRGQVFGDKRFISIGDDKRANVWSVELVEKPR
jgi:hypothetical protein